MAKYGLAEAGVPDEEIVKVLRGARGRNTTSEDLVNGCKEHRVTLAQDEHGCWSSSSVDPT